MVDERIIGIKIAVHNEEESEQVQQKLFELGARWIGSSSDIVSYTSSRYLFIDSKGVIEKIDMDKEDFDNDIREEIYVKDLLKMEIEPQKMNFAKFIGKNEKILCIFGDNMMLQCLDFCDETSILYDNIDRDNYNKNINYEETRFDKLQYGDVFITKNRVEATLRQGGDFNLEDFEIYLGRDKGGHDMSLCLTTQGEAPMTRFRYYYSPVRTMKFVYKFLRE